MLIRPSTAADAQAMLDVARALPQWFNAGGIEEMTKDFQVHQGLVAVNEVGAVVGFATFSPLSVDAALLSWIGVRPEERRHGLGRRFIEALDEKLVALGFSRLEVETLADTADYQPYEETRRFYLAARFKPKAFVPERWGPGQDALVLTRNLGPRPGV